MRRFEVSTSTTLQRTRSPTASSILDLCNALDANLGNVDETVDRGFKRYECAERNNANDLALDE